MHCLYCIEELLNFLTIQYENKKQAAMLEEWTGGL